MKLASWRCEHFFYHITHKRYLIIHSRNSWRWILGPLQTLPPSRWFLSCGHVKCALDQTCWGWYCYTKENTGTKLLKWSGLIYNAIVFPPLFSSFPSFFHRSVSYLRTKSDEGRHRHHLSRFESVQWYGGFLCVCVCVCMALVTLCSFDSARGSWKVYI